MDYRFIINANEDLFKIIEDLRNDLNVSKSSMIKLLLKIGIDSYYKQVLKK